MRIAAVGCSHGELDQIYAKIKQDEEKSQKTIDLVLMCGDFQAIRNDIDLKCMAVPPKYRKLGNFYQYYNGELKAPYLTVVIGGNHEASNHMDELPHGGWLAPNIYYLGRAGVVRYNGVRIGGLSGIYKEGHYFKGHYETTPYNPDSLRSIYHVREFDVRKLLLIQEPMDIMLSHDWPRGIEHCGDLQRLLRIKPYFERDINTKSLGNPASAMIMHQLQPKWWFSAHLHVYYKAIVDHNAKLTPEQVLSSGSKDVNEPAGQGVTKFLALDKPLERPAPGRAFVDYIDIESPEGKEEEGLTYDLEWLAITRAMQPNLNVDRRPTKLPKNSDLRSSVEQELLYLNMEMDMDQLDLNIPSNFQVNVPAGAVLDSLADEEARKLSFGVDNPQTIEFCKLIGIEYIRAKLPPTRVRAKERSPDREESKATNVNEEDANKKRKTESES